MVKDARTFKTQTEVRRFLDGEGFKVNSSTLSRHCREGALGTNADGLFEIEAVLAYAGRKLKRKESGKTLTKEEKDRCYGQAGSGTGTCDGEGPSRENQAAQGRGWHYPA